MPVKALSETEYSELINLYLLSAFHAVSQVQWRHSVIHVRLGQNRKHGIICGHVMCDISCTKRTVRE